MDQLLYSSASWFEPTTVPLNLFTVGRLNLVAANVHIDVMVEIANCLIFCLQRSEEHLREYSVVHPLL